MLSKCFLTSVILIMCACALPVLAASRGSMRGKVVDCAGDPVAKAYILVHPSGQPGSDVRVPVQRDGDFQSNSHLVFTMSSLPEPVSHLSALSSS